ncbi:MAG TPA: LamG domain-containing protein [Sedimentisphaerales bacterium]|nr:LamG domain-containing protein [Sedimentisphaerales bacterium]
MCKKLIYFVSVVLLLGSVSQAEDIQWTDLGADHLWSNPENWDLGRVPTLADEVRIDVPAAGAPNGPVIQDGIDAKAKGIFNEAPGKPTLTMTGGTLEVAEWIWWGDGADSFGIWVMSGGTVTVANEFELGWDGGAGTLTITGGTINAGEAVIPTGSGAFGELFLNGGTYNVTKPGGLNVKENGLIDITEGTLVLEGDETAKINDLVAAGLITAYGGAGQFELDFDGRNPGKTTLTAIPEPEPVNPGADGLIAHWPLDEGAGNTAADIVGGHDGTLKGGVAWAGEGSPVNGDALSFDGHSDGANHTTDPGTINWVSVDPFDVVGPGITLAAWIRPEGFDVGDARIITKQKTWSSSDIWWMLSTYTDGTALRMRLKTDDGGADNGTTTMFSDTGYLEAGVWSHVAATYDGSKMRLYHNAVEIMSMDKTGTIQADPTAAVAIGNSPLGDPGGLRAPFNGLIDDVQIYDRALSEGEVLYLAGARATPVDPGTDGLVAFYALDGDANDSSGNELHGTLVGDAAFVEGKVGMALDLDGDGDYVDGGSPPELVITEAISISCWVNPMQLGGEQGFAGLDAGYYFKAHGEGVRFTTPGILDHSSANLTLEAGVWQHVAATFQPGQDEGLVFYLNGVETERMTSSAINTGTGPFRIGNNQWNEFLTGLIDEVAIYGRILSAGEIRYLAGIRPMDDFLGPDVTAPGDVVQGVPNDGLMNGDDFGWPGAETPDLAIDDDIGTKFLHFKGDIEPTGIQVEPASGASIVTGLTLTTANDSPARDPATFELSGSNDSIDGPYTLIASGDVVDFTQEAEWPRFTMNATPISFDNDVAYKYYQLMFPIVRDAAGDNSMQIAEVELRVTKIPGSN